MDATNRLEKGDAAKAKMPVSSESANERISYMNAHIDPKWFDHMDILGENDNIIFIPGLN